MEKSELFLWASSLGLIGAMILCFMVWGWKPSLKQMFGITGIFIIANAIYSILQRGTKPDGHFNDAPEGRDIAPGEEDEKGWTQEIQKTGDPSKGDLPVGVKKEDIETRITITPRVDVIPIKNPKEGESTEDFQKRMRKKYTLIIVILLFSTCFAQGVVVEKEDLNEMLLRLDKLAKIEKAKPVITFSPIELLQDSAGRIYNKTLLTGSLEISTLKYNIKMELETNIIRKRKYNIFGEIFSVSLGEFYEAGYGIAATVELKIIRPSIYAHKESFGLGARLKFIGNSAFIIGADYPSWKPRAGLFFKL